MYMAEFPTQLTYYIVHVLILYLQATIILYYS